MYLHADNDKRESANLLREQGMTECSNNHMKGFFTFLSNAYETCGKKKHIYQSPLKRILVTETMRRDICINKIMCTWTSSVNNNSSAPYTVN